MRLLAVLLFTLFLYSGPDVFGDTADLQYNNLFSERARRRNRTEKNSQKVIAPFLFYFFSRPRHPRKSEVEPWKAETRPSWDAGGRRLTSWWKTWASRRFLAGWGGRARQPKTPVQLARRGAAPAALDVAKNIPTDAGRTRPAFFPRKNASGQGKDARPAAGGRRVSAAAPRSLTSPAQRLGHNFPKNAWRTTRTTAEIRTIKKGAKDVAGWSPLSLARPRFYPTLACENGTSRAPHFFLSRY